MAKEGIEGLKQPSVRMASVTVVYQAVVYKNLQREKIAEDVRKEGFDPIYINDPPGHLYPHHRHPETKFLVFLQGGMEVEVKDQKFNRCGFIPRSLLR